MEAVLVAWVLAANWLGFSGGSGGSVLDSLYSNNSVGSILYECFIGANTSRISTRTLGPTLQGSVSDVS